MQRLLSTMFSPRDWDTFFLCKGDVLRKALGPTRAAPLSHVEATGLASGVLRSNVMFRRMQSTQPFFNLNFRAAVTMGSTMRLTAQL